LEALQFVSVAAGGKGFQQNNFTKKNFLINILKRVKVLNQKISYSARSGSPKQISSSSSHVLYKRSNLTNGRKGYLMLEAHIIIMKLLNFLG